MEIVCHTMRRQHWSNRSMWFGTQSCCYDSITHFCLETNRCLFEISISHFWNQPGSVGEKNDKICTSVGSAACHLITQRHLSLNVCLSWMCSSACSVCIPRAQGQLHIKVIKGNMASLLASSTLKQLLVLDTQINKPSVVCTEGHAPDPYGTEEMAGPFCNVSASRRTTRHWA